MSCCEPRTAKHAHHGCCDCTPVCCSPHGFARRFISSREKQECLEQYREQLEKEIAGVNERIKEIESGDK